MKLNYLLACFVMLTNTIVYGDDSLLLETSFQVRDISSISENGHFVLFGEKSSKVFVSQTNSDSNLQSILLPDYLSDISFSNIVTSKNENVFYLIGFKPDQFAEYILLRLDVNSGVVGVAFLMHSPLELLSLELLSLVFKSNSLFDNHTVAIAKKDNYIYTVDSTVPAIFRIDLLHTNFIDSRESTLDSGTKFVSESGSLVEKLEEHYPSQILASVTSDLLLVSYYDNQSFSISDTRKGISRLINMEDSSRSNYNKFLDASMSIGEGDSSRSTSQRTGELYFLNYFPSSRKLSINSIDKDFLSLKPIAETTIDALLPAGPISSSYVASRALTFIGVAVNKELFMYEFDGNTISLNGTQRFDSNITHISLDELGEKLVVVLDSEPTQILIRDTNSLLVDPPYEKLRVVQKTLSNAGFSLGAIDGIIGFKTINAISEFQNSIGLSESGELDERTNQAIATLQSELSRGIFDNSANRFRNSNLNFDYENTDWCESHTKVLRCPANSRKRDMDNIEKPYSQSVCNNFDINPDDHLTAQIDHYSNSEYLCSSRHSCAFLKYLLPGYYLDLCTLSESYVLRNLYHQIGEKISVTDRGYGVHKITFGINLDRKQSKFVKDIRFRFNHPSFNNPKIAKNTGDAYEAYWDGWGCVDQAEAQITDINNSVTKISFNYCDYW